MKTENEILQEKIGSNVFFSFNGDIIISGKLNANDLVDVIKEYGKQCAQKALNDAIENVCSEDNFHHPTKLLESIRRTEILTP